MLLRPVVKHHTMEGVCLDKTASLWPATKRKELPEVWSTILFKTHPQDLKMPPGSTSQTVHSLLTAPLQGPAFKTWASWAQNVPVLQVLDFASLGILDFQIRDVQVSTEIS